MYYPFIRRSGNKKKTLMMNTFSDVPVFYVVSRWGQCIWTVNITMIRFGKFEEITVLIAKTCYFDSNLTYHSMARLNLNKSVELVTNTTTASKYIPKRSRICINRNPLFQTSLHKIFKNCFL